MVRDGIMRDTERGRGLNLSVSGTAGLGEGS